MIAGDLLNAPTFASSVFASATLGNLALSGRLYGLAVHPWTTRRGYRGNGPNRAHRLGNCNWGISPTKGRL